MGVFAKLKTLLGWATGDRRVEAKGRLEQLEDDRGDRGADAESVLDEAELHVRSDHDELAPSAEPEGRRPKSPPESG